MLLTDRTNLMLVGLCSFLLGCSIVPLSFYRHGTNLDTINAVSSVQESSMEALPKEVTDTTTSPCSGCEINNTITTTFESSWQKLRLTLCPNMRPNRTLGPILFSLARDELHMVKWDDEGSMMSFYTFGGGGTSFIPTAGNPFLYANIYKAANNQINDWLRRFTFDPSSWQKLQDRAMLTALLDEVRKINTEPPCIVTAVRDPISHFLSGYNEIEFRYIQEPSRMTSPPALLYTRYRNGTTQRFEQFVADYVGGPKREKWDYSKLQLSHVYSMTGILSVLEDKNATLTDYLPSLENLTERWPAFVAQACPFMEGLVDAAPDMKVAGQHESSGDPYGSYGAAKAVWKQQGPTARALCVLHAIDYACWEKLPDGVPELCQEVYSSPEFVNQVLN